MALKAKVEAVSVNKDHSFSKVNMDRIRVVRDHGVESDAHFGTTVQHLHLIEKDPARPNLRQVHLIALERIHEWNALGHSVRCGSLGENITTSGLDLEHLPAGTKMRFGSGAEILLTGLRKPCHQVDKFSAGLLRLTVSDTKDAEIPFRIGVMGVVLAAGEILKGEGIQVVLPPESHQFMEKV
ncbi:MAG: Putative metal-sulfur cluster biosynthesis proteins YuaD [Gammaproteobacteria bacterium]|nr:MAG: Putative metal-sulfur cluster biosynthesis proteins YuaD [Gammaproteobacteria bacterium]